MIEGSVEFVKYRNISRENIEKNFSSIITDTIYDSCYDRASQSDDYNCSYACDGDFKKCQYTQYCWKTPKFFMIDYDDYDSLKEDYIECRKKEISSPLDCSEPVYCVEDIIIRRNCNALIVQQKIYRGKTDKMGYVVRALLSPSIDDDKDKTCELINLYSYDRKWKICLWSPTFKDLFSIMSKDKDIFLEMLEELSLDINQDTELLVEKYLVNRKEETKNANWTIESFCDDEGEYYYEIDCRALFSIIKQIMICEDKLYSGINQRGRFRIIDEFKHF